MYFQKTSLELVALKSTFKDIKATITPPPASAEPGTVPYVVDLYIGYDVVKTVTCELTATEAEAVTIAEGIVAAVKSQLLDGGITIVIVEDF